MGQTEIRLLVVDDDEDMRATLSDFLTSNVGVKVRTAGSVVEAQQLMKPGAPPFDLILTDLKLPDGSGLDVVKAARACSSETLVSIVTGFASLDTAIEAIRLGAYDYITKPFSLDEIGVQVRNMIERISLSKENARLSLKLQEIYAEVNRLRSEKAESARFHEEMRRELSENGRKLDMLLGARPKNGFI